MRRLLLLLFLLSASEIMVQAAPVPKGWKRCQITHDGQQLSVDFPGNFKTGRVRGPIYFLVEKNAVYLIGVESTGLIDEPSKYVKVDGTDGFGGAFKKGASHGFKTSFGGSGRVGYRLGAFASWRSSFVKYSQGTAAKFKLENSSTYRLNGWRGQRETYRCDSSTGQARVLTGHSIGVQVAVFEKGPPSKKAETFLNSLILPPL